jgi:hypothetical protein
VNRCCAAPVPVCTPDAADLASNPAAEDMRTHVSLQVTWSSIQSPGKLQIPAITSTAQCPKAAPWSHLVLQIPSCKHLRRHSLLSSRVDTVEHCSELTRPMASILDVYPSSPYCLTSPPTRRPDSCTIGCDRCYLMDVGSGRDYHSGSLAWLFRVYALRGILFDRVYGARRDQGQDHSQGHGRSGLFHCRQTP